MSDDIKSGCTNKKLIEWEKRAWALQIVGLTQKSKNFNDGSEFWALAAGICFKNLNIDLQLVLDSNFLMVDYVGISSEQHTAVLIADLDIVLIFDILPDDYIEYVGLMELEGFWEYMDSFPNYFKHFKSSSVNRVEYWQDKKS